MSSLVQYIVVRGDLKWPLGALIAQACHASLSAIIRYKDDAQTQQYTADPESMTKVVLKCEDEEQLLQLCKRLEEENVGFVSWNEMPENIKTCLATVPRERNTLRPFFRHLKLFE